MPDCGSTDRAWRLRVWPCASCRLLAQRRAEGDRRMPDLQALVDRAGRRHAASIGEEYIEDPFRRAKEKPHQGGYRHITPEEWARWDRANEVFQARRREGLKP